MLGANSSKVTAQLVVVYHVALVSYHTSTLMQGQTTSLKTSNINISGRGVFEPRPRRIVVRVAEHGGELKNALEAGERGVHELTRTDQ